MNALNSLQAKEQQSPEDILMIQQVYSSGTEEERKPKQWLSLIAATFLIGGFIVSQKNSVVHFY